MYALQIKNRSESDPHSCEETQATAKIKPGKHSELLIRFEATTSAIPAMLYQMSYMKPCWKRWSRVSSIYSHYMRRAQNDVHMIQLDHAYALKVKNTSESDLHSYEAMLYEVIKPKQL